MSYREYTLEHTNAGTSNAKLWRVETTKVLPTAGSATQKAISTRKILIGGFSGSEISRSVILDVTGEETVVTTC